MLKNTVKLLKGYDAAYSIAEKLIITFNFLLIVMGSSGVGGLLVYLRPKDTSWSYGAYCFLFICVILIIFACYYLFISAKLKGSESRYIDVISQIPSRINPIAENYNNELINVADLKLPHNDMQKQKTFRRCTLYGPSTVCILGGTITGSTFVNNGCAIIIDSKDPKIVFTGVIGFFHCNFYECTFVDITIISTPDFAAAVQRDTPKYPMVRAK